MLIKKEPSQPSL